MLSFVKKGEAVLITDRDRVIDSHFAGEFKKQLHPRGSQSFGRKGEMITFPDHKVDKEIPAPIELPGKLISEMAIEDRR